MSTFLVRVTPGAKQNKVEQTDATHLKVWVTAKAEKGKANAAVVKLLAEFLDIPQNRITIKRGEWAKTKVIAIEGQGRLGV